MVLATIMGHSPFEQFKRPSSQVMEIEPVKPVDSKEKEKEKETRTKKLHEYYKSKYNLNVKNKIELTHFFDGIYDNDKNRLIRMVSRGYDVSLQNERGLTPIHCAVFFERISIIGYLLDTLGANPNSSNCDTYSPLHDAVDFKNYPIIQMLLTHGAVPDVFDCNMFTPLHRAVSNKDHDIAILLLENKANPNTVNAYDETPFVTAIMKSDHDMVSILFKYGVVIDPYEFANILEIARTYSNHEMFKIILDQFMNNQ